MTTTPLLRSRSRAAAPLIAFTLLATLAASPARADRCDELASQLKSAIDGLKVGNTAAGAIFLSHPQAKRVRLVCASRSVSNEFFAAAEGRKPTAAFFDLVAGASAIIFTIPKSDTLRGARRCVGRLGFLRGDDIRTRFRRLDIHCTRSKTETTVTVSREKD
jgi:hypothetical protein